MIRPVQILLPVLLIVAACSSSVGPSRGELADALQTSPSNIRALHCHDISEEPTEFGCSYRERDASGVWVPQDVMVAINGSAWIVIDGPGGSYPP
jgi:hypothetical protein